MPYVHFDHIKCYKRINLEMNDTEVIREASYEAENQIDGRPDSCL